MVKCRLPSTEPAVLEQAFGLAMPKAFARLIELVREPDGSVIGDEGSLFQSVTGLLLADQSDAYPGTPPEMFLVGRTGMDGVNCGLVWHDPRLAGELPLAMFDPTHLRGDYLGLDARRSIGVLMGLRLAQRDPDGISNEDAMRVIARMGFDAAELPAEQPIGLRPRTPPGWRLAMTADGLGVMAEAGQFEPGQSFEDDPESFESLDITDYVAAAHEAIVRGFPATALWHLRNGYTFWAPQGMPGQLTSLMSKVYASMGRHALVARLQVEVALHRQAE